MSTRNKLLDYLIKTLVEHLMVKYGSTYDSALDVVLSSNTYNRLLNDGYLKEEGSLYICEQLDKELSLQ